VLGRALRDTLYGVGPIDLSVLGGVAIFLLAAALIACFILARRATRIGPMVALRYE